MKLIVFDMDGTLLDGRTILFIAEEFGFYNEALELIDSNLPKLEISLRLAKMLAGVNTDRFMDVIRRIPLMEGAEEIVKTLRSMGHKTAIVTDSYDVVAEYLMERLGMDAAVGNKLNTEDGMFTGELDMPLNCLTKEVCNNPSICKKEILKELSTEFGIPLSETVAIGDNSIDVCMLSEAGLGIAFDPKVKELEEAADVAIKSKDLRDVLRHIKIK